MAECMFVKGTHTFNKFCQMLSYFVQLQSITDNQQLQMLLQLLKSWKLENNTNTFVLIVDKVVAFLPPFRAVKLILTVFHRSWKYILKDHLGTFGDHIQLTLYPPIHGEIVTTVPRIRLLRVNIVISVIMRATMNANNISPQEVRDVDVVLTMFLGFPIHFPYHTFNKLQEMFLQMCFLQ